MNRFLIILTLISFYILNAKTLTFAPLPMKDTKTIYTQFSPMVNYLEKHLNNKIELVYTSSYDEILEKFIAGKIDIAYLGPLPYLSLEKIYPYTTSLVNFKNHEGESSYTCSFVSFISNNNSLKNIKNSKIALTQPLSTCGYLFVNNILNSFNTNIEENKYKYLGRHDNVALSVIRDEFNYGGLKTDIAKEYYHLGLKEIKKSKKIPNFILVANGKTLNKNTIFKIKESLLNIKEIELSKWHKSLRYGVKKTNIKDYQHLRELINSTIIPQKSNF